MSTVALGMPGTWELVFLAILALLIFGPERLPEMARNIGKTVSTLKREATSTMDELKRAADAEGLSEVAGELKQTTADLKASAALTGPVASAARPVDPGKPTVEAAPTADVPAEPAPFDPDAT